MGNKDGQEHVLRYKLLYTALILLIYIIGREIPLYGVDFSAYQHMTTDVGDLLMQTIGGDIYRCSLFALGISPYMISSIVVQLVMAVRKMVSNERISMKKTNRWTVFLMLLIASLQALLRVRELQFIYEGDVLLFAQWISGIQMMVGVLVIMWLSERNKKYGIGGQTALILVNILDTTLNLFLSDQITEYVTALVIVVAVILIMVTMENTEKRLPVQRISIYNIYADKNYIAIKLNPIGVMPVMFAMAFFMLPQLLLQVLLHAFPEVTEIVWLQENMSLTQPLGIAVYIGIMYFLTIAFALIFLSPGDMAEQLLKGGDSIIGIHAGRDTKRYLRRNMVTLSIVSATVMGSCLVIPLVLQFYGRLEGVPSTLPSSIMMLTGIWCNLFREYEAVKSFDAYKPFL